MSFLEFCSEDSWHGRVNLDGSPLKKKIKESSLVRSVQGLAAAAT